MKKISPQTALQTSVFSQNHKEHRVTINTFDAGSETSSEFKANLTKDEVKKLLLYIDENFKEE